MDRILLLGASGFVGHQLWARRGSHELIAAGHRGELPAGCETLRGDLAELAGEIAKVAPRAVINLAAMSSFAQCEREPDEAWRVNAEGAALVAESCAKAGIRLLHVSTDMVHDGAKAPYDDDAAATAHSVYGRSKAAGEEQVLARHPGALVARVALCYGPLGPSGFGRLSWMRDAVLAGEGRFFVDEFRTPIWVADLCQALLKLALGEARGRINLAGPERVSRAEFAGILRDLLGSGSVAPAQRPKERPGDTSLSIERARALIAFDPLGPRAGLRQALAE